MICFWYKAERVIARTVSENADNGIRGIRIRKSRLVYGLLTCNNTFNFSNMLRFWCHIDNISLTLPLIYMYCNIFVSSVRISLFICNQRQCMKHYHESLTLGWQWYTDMYSQLLRSNTQYMSKMYMYYWYIFQISLITDMFTPYELNEQLIQVNTPNQLRIFIFQ